MSTGNSGSRVRRSRIPNWLSVVLKLGLGLALIAAVLYVVDLRKVVRTALGMDWRYLLAVVIVYYGDRALMVYKWNLLLHAKDVRIPFSVLYNTYLTAPLAAMFLPSSVGGDIFRVYALSRYKARVAAVLASVIADRVIGFVTMLALVSISVGAAVYLMRERWSEFSGIAWLLVLSGVGMIAAFIILMRSLSGDWIKRIVDRFARFPIVKKLYQVYELSYEYRKQKGVLARATAWSFLEQWMPIAGDFLMVKALHIDVSILALIAIVPVIMLATRIPISLDGLGVAEGLSVLLFGLVGVSAEQALLIILVGRAQILFCSLPWGVHYFVSGRRASIGS